MIFVYIKPEDKKVFNKNEKKSITYFLIKIQKLHFYKLKLTTK